jgi:hypothetical protein
VVYGLAIAVSTGVSAANLLNVRALLSANDRSRWCTIWSLVERGTYQIDEIIDHRGWDTIDKVRHEGHFYSSKPPLLPTIAAGFYWSVKKCTGWDLLADTHDVARLVLVFINLLPMTVALLLLALMVERQARSDLAKVYVVIAAAAATSLSTFLVTLNNHTVAAISVIFALYPAIRIVADGAGRPIHFALCGFFAAFAAMNELPAALFVVLLFGLLLAQNSKSTFSLFVPAALLPVIAFFATNYLATGDWKPFYTAFGTEKYLYEVEGIPSYWMEPKGIDQGVDSPLVYLLHCTLGHHGIFSLSPIFLLSVLTWATMRKWRDRPLRLFLWIGLLASVVVLSFYLTRTANYNYGGKSASLRWMIWLIPLWLIAIIPALDEWGRLVWFRLLAGGLLLVSVFSASYAISNPWQHPWLFVVMQEQGWIDYSDKPLPKLDPPQATWFRTLPQEGDWIEFSVPASDGSAERLHLADGGSTRRKGHVVRRLLVTWNRGTGTERSQTWHINEEAFRRGAPPEEFLVWPEADPTAENRQSAYAFLQGMPQQRNYRGGKISYLKTPLRTDAFRCRRAASQVYYRSAETNEKLRYRVDVWLSDKVPLGVVRFVLTVFQPKSSLVVSRRQFTATAVSRILNSDDAHPQ